jgi:hypothetical protein
LPKAAASATALVTFVRHRRGVRVRREPGEPAGENRVGERPSEPFVQVDGEEGDEDEDGRPAAWTAAPTSRKPRRRRRLCASTPGT